MISSRRVPGGVTPGMRFSSCGVPDGQQPAQVKVADPAAALGLVHVMRRDEQRDALGRQAKQQVPQVAPGHRVDAGRRLVEEDQPRPCSSAQASASRCFQPPDS